jgi:predicted nucleic acid-binding protein
LFNTRGVHGKGSLSILVDTSVWIEHLRSGNRHLSELLDSNMILMHPFVLGELACVRLVNRKAVLALLAVLPGARVAGDEEVLYFIGERALMGRDIGYVDAHLLAATALYAPARLWTSDRALRAVADGLGLAFEGAGA